MVRLARSTRFTRRLDVVPLVRLGCGAVVGLALGVAVRWPSPLSAVLAAWAATAAVFVAWTWVAIGTMGPEATRAPRRGRSRPARVLTRSWSLRPSSPSEGWQASCLAGPRERR